MEIIRKLYLSHFV